MEKYCKNCETYISIKEIDFSNECPNCWGKLIYKEKANDKLDVTTKEFIITKIVKSNQEKE